MEGKIKNILIIDKYFYHLKRCILPLCFSCVSRHIGSTERDTENHCLKISSGSMLLCKFEWVFPTANHFWAPLWFNKPFSLKCVHAQSTCGLAVCTAFTGEPLSGQLLWTRLPNSFMLPLSKDTAFYSTRSFRTVYQSHLDIEHLHPCIEALTHSHKIIAMKGVTGNPVNIYWFSLWRKTESKWVENEKLLSSNDC